MRRTVLMFTALMSMGAAAGGRVSSSQVDDIAAAGRAVYKRECASCHGVGGMGYGPAAYVLKKMPPDLTRYSSRTVPFPKDAIRNIITGHVRRVPAPLPIEMPKWRNALDTPIPAAGGITEMEALLDHLERIQLTPFGWDGITPAMLAAAGEPLFKAHCTACHGSDARGHDGYTVGPAMDLTLIAARNAGNFEIRKVYESIARCGEDWPASDMPSWQHAFTRAGWNGYLTMKNIEALATYVESIQR